MINDPYNIIAKNTKVHTPVQTAQRKQPIDYRPQARRRIHPNTGFITLPVYNLPSVEEQQSAPARYLKHRSYRLGEVNSANNNQLQMPPSSSQIILIAYTSNWSPTTIAMDATTGMVINVTISNSDILTGIDLVNQALWEEFTFDTTLFGIEFPITAIQVVNNDTSWHTVDVMMAA